MKKIMSKTILGVIILLLLVQAVFAASWPADSSGTELASGLGTYEPSGITYHSGLNKLFVVSDEGKLSSMNLDGSSVTTWSFRDAFNYNDFEGVAVDSTSNYVYVLTEYPYAITQFNSATGALVQSWSLSSVVPAPTDTRYSLEGITYIPAEDYTSSSGRGVFVVGSQGTGTLYFLDIDTSVTGGSVTLLTSMKPVSGGISDLFYNAETNVLYALYGSSVSEMDIYGTVSASYSTPAYAEGVTLATACPASTTTIYLAYDTPASVKSYNNYPITCPSTSSGSGSSGSGSSTTASWPASSSGTNVGSGLGSTYEPSGVVWSSESNKLIVVNDNGAVSTMNSDGSSVTSWTLSGDLEGVAVGTTSSTAYVLNEYPFAIYTFDTTTGTKTATLDLSNIGITTPSTTSNGLEGVAYIPEGDHTYSVSGAIFAVGSSDDGRIYFVSGAGSLLGSVQPTTEAITDMYYAADTALLYVLYGTTLREMSVDGTVVATYTSVPGTDPEGLTLVADCAASTADIYVANDGGNTVVKHTGYPVTCVSTSSSGSSGGSTPVDPDTDDDGLLDTEEATYGTNPNLADTDSDGLTDYQEVITYGTSGVSSDTDSDGLTDYQEIVTYGTNALDADSDDDALSDGAEVLTYSTNPLDSDSDNDSLNDYQEVVTYGTDANASDSDNDSLTDYQEVITYGTDPLNTDTDSGTVSDGQEVTNGTNPLDGTDDVPEVIDPNLISSYSIDSVNALVTVYYADGHSNTINPFTGTDPILVGLNYDNTVLVVTNGKRMKTYQNAVAKDNEYINKYTPSAMTLTVTHATSSDAVVLTYVVSGKTKTARFTLSGTNLVRS